VSLKRSTFIRTYFLRRLWQKGSHIFTGEMALHPSDARETTAVFLGLAKKMKKRSAQPTVESSVLF
jgi:hypothetical protein